MKVNPTFILLACLICFQILKSQQKDPIAIESTKRWIYKLGVKYRIERTACKLLIPEFHPATSGALQFTVRDKKSLWSFQSGLYETRFNYEGLKANYLQIPLNMRIDKFGFYFSGGVYAGYLYNTNISGIYKDFSCGVNYTLGYEIKINKHLTTFAELHRLQEVRTGYNRLGFSSYCIGFGLNYNMR